MQTDEIFAMKRQDLKNKITALIDEYVLLTEEKDSIDESAEHAVEYEMQDENEEVLKLEHEVQKLTIKLEKIESEIILKSREKQKLTIQEMNAYVNSDENVVILKNEICDVELLIKLQKLRLPRHPMRVNSILYNEEDKVRKNSLINRLELIEWQLEKYQILINLDFWE